jgi:hypothetical protein
VPRGVQGDGLVLGPHPSPTRPRATYCSEAQQRGRAQGGVGTEAQCQLTFTLGIIRRNRNTMSMLTSRVMSHSDSRPSLPGFLGRPEASGSE